MEVQGAVGDLALECVEEKAAIPGLHQRQRTVTQLVVAEVPHPPGDLFGGADGQSLPLLHGADELACGGEIVEGPGIEPGGAAGEHLDLQAAVLEVTAVEVGDLELPTSGGRQRPGTVDDGLVVEVEAGDGEVGAGHSRLLLDGK